MTDTPSPASPSPASPWPNSPCPTSPWHDGERRLQALHGVDKRLEEIGHRIIRDAMPEQHSTFFAQLPSLLIGAVDANGAPWASILTGAPGFAQAANPKSLHIKATLNEGDPVAPLLQAGAPVGLLGLEPHSRRRNRVNGRLSSAAPGEIALAVEHSFGNCPKYIQTRHLTPSATPSETSVPEIADHLTPAAREIIHRADSFYVASYADRNGARQADVSHRGGRPGFVRIAEDGALTIPDFSGNLFFNTLGNILSTGKAGLLFVDFDNGDALQLTGEAELILNGPEITQAPGAERLWTVRPTQMTLRRNAVPLRGAIEEWSPNTLRTGVWPEAA
ncbi:MAG: pyridoxamine 5'-phosphate oxidase family protein [Rhodobacteraceae bacterium]|nr:pyridoxamine 5'-phosphate oxidase family protein [Paracoccaceae bacterium]